MPNQLTDFIDKARKRGFADNQIKEALRRNTEWSNFPKRPNKVVK